MWLPVCMFALTAEESSFVCLLFLSLSFSFYLSSSFSFSLFLFLSSLPSDQSCLVFCVRCWCTISSLQCKGPLWNVVLFIITASRHTANQPWLHGCHGNKVSQSKPRRCKKSYIVSSNSHLICWFQDGHLCLFAPSSYERSPRHTATEIKKSGKKGDKLWGFQNGQYFPYMHPAVAGAATGSLCIMHA